MKRTFVSAGVALRNFTPLAEEDRGRQEAGLSEVDGATGFSPCNMERRCTVCGEGAAIAMGQDDVVRTDAN